MVEALAGAFRDMVEVVTGAFRDIVEVVAGRSVTLSELRILPLGGISVGVERLSLIHI